MEMSPSRWFAESVLHDFKCIFSKRSRIWMELRFPHPIYSVEAFYNDVETKTFRKTREIP